MTIYFSANCRELKENIDLYRQIIAEIHRQGNLVDNNWIEAALHKKLAAQGDWQSAWYDFKNGLKSADALIVEATGQSAFGVGYECATALQAKKPVLALYKKGVSSYVSGLESNEYMRVVAYTPETLAQELSFFFHSLMPHDPSDRRYYLKPEFDVS